MSSSGSKTPTSGSSAGSTDQRVQELLDQLQNLLNQLQNVVLPDDEAPPAVLQETRNRLRSLESEADDLRARIDQLLDTVDKKKAAAIRKLLRKP